MSQTNARFQGGGVILPQGASAGSINVGEKALIQDTDGTIALLDSLGLRTTVDATPMSKALNRARSLLGTTITTPLGTDFENDQWHKLVTVAGAPTAAMTTTERGGVIILDSSATATSNGIILPHGTTIEIDNPQTSKWYYYMRAALTTAIDSVTSLHPVMCTAAGGAPVIRFGAVGSVSTAFYSWLTTNNAGTTTASGATTLAIDTNVYHEFEIYTDGTTVSFAIDGIVLATTPASNLGTSACAFGAQANNGGTAASRAMKIDKRYFCCPPP